VITARDPMDPRRASTDTSRTTGAQALHLHALRCIVVTMLINDPRKISPLDSSGV
jgi:hypothetical protein